MLRLAGVLAVVALGLSAAHTKGTVGEGQLPQCDAHLRVRYGFSAGACGRRSCLDAEKYHSAPDD